MHVTLNIRVVAITYPERYVFNKRLNLCEKMLSHRCNISKGTITIKMYVCVNVRFSL